MHLANRPVTNSLGWLAFLGVFLIFIKSALEVVQLSSLSSGLGTFLSFVPNIIVAIIIMLTTYVFASFSKKTIVNKLTNLEPYFTSLIGVSAFFGLMILGTVFAASQLNIDMTLATSICLLYTSPSPRDQRGSRMPSSA